GFGFCGCGWGGALDCASALVASIAAAMQKRSRFIGRRKLLAVRRGNSRGGSAGAQQRESAAHSNIGNILVMLSIRRVLPLLFLAVSARAQGPNYLVSPNVVYNVASGEELKLDVYRPRDAAAPVPVAMYIHGGGWVAGTKEGSVLGALEFLRLGMAVVNVEYRLAKVAQAPAAVEDCRCALRWIIRNAERLKFDPGRIVVVGGSAGGHLALMTGMVERAAGFDRTCPAPESVRWTGSETGEAKVAAIINYFGITDVWDMP